MVSPEKEKALSDKMRELGIFNTDIIEKFVRCGGSGGQKVNKTSTCVYLKHVPTGIEVKMQRERSRALNRFLAKRLLVQKIEDRILGRERAQRDEFEKIRRRKRKRSKRAKERMLRDKKIRSKKKTLRQDVDLSQEG